MKSAVVAAGGLLVLATGFLPWPDAVAVLSRTWPILLFLVAITLVADLCDHAGLFDVAAHCMAIAGRGSVSLLFVLTCALATVTTMVLSLDTTAVLLTPVLLTMTGRFGLHARPFAFAAVWLANGASLLLPVSNLTNLLAQPLLGPDVGAFVRTMWPAQLAVLAVIIAVLWFRHRGVLRGRYLPPSGRARPADPVLCAVAACTVVGFAVATLVDVPAWAAAGAALIVLVVAFLLRRHPAASPARLVHEMPVSMVIFALGLFLVMESVAHRVSSSMAHLVDALPGGPVGIGVASGVVANVVNNLPAYLALEPFAGDRLTLAAVLVGVNAGPVVLLWASLANLLWRDRCRARGIDIPLWVFAREGLLVAVPAVVAGVLAMMAVDVTGAW